MNEKIRELAEQADELADNEIQMPGEYHPDWHTIRDKKFAELIVRECIGILEPKSRYMGEGPEVLKDKIRQIKLHFGVEE